MVSCLTRLHQKWYVISMQYGDRNQHCLVSGSFTLHTVLRPCHLIVKLPVIMQCLFLYLQMHNLQYCSFFPIANFKHFILTFFLNNYAKNEFLILIFKKTQSSFFLFFLFLFFKFH